MASPRSTLPHMQTTPTSGMGRVPGTLANVPTSETPTSPRHTHSRLPRAIQRNQRDGLLEPFRRASLPAPLSPPLSPVSLSLKPTSESSRDGGSDSSSDSPSTESSPLPSPRESPLLQTIDIKARIGVSREAQRKAINAATIPSELIIHILKHVTATADLKSCILVCKSWCHCGVELLWHKPVFTRDASLIKLLVALSRPTQMFQYAMLIRRLNFSFLGENVSDSIMQRLSACHRLERLTLGGCRRLTDAGLTKLIGNAQNLIALDISDIENLTDEVVKLVGEQCKWLQGLNVSLCKKITDSGIMAVAARCRNLKRIKLNGCERITDESVIALANNCPALLELDLTNCNQITNKAIHPVLERCGALRELRLAFCTRISDEAFTKTMPSNFEQLRILDLTSCMHITDNALLKVVTSSPRLRVLILAKCMNITDKGIYHITRLGKHLHHLHLGHCSHITDHSITELARHCTRLRYLDLACCTLLTDKSVTELAHLQKLRRIGLVKCTNITDRAIYDLGRSQALERVHLSYCMNLNVAAVLELLNLCSRLTHLSLTGVPAFMREDIQRFCRPPPREFNANQRQVFCVFSGKGVKELRLFLNSIVAISRERPADINANSIENTDRGSMHFEIVPSNGFDGEAGIDDSSEIDDRANHLRVGTNETTSSVDADVLDSVANAHISF